MSIGERIVWGVYSFVATAQTVVGLGGLILFAAVGFSRLLDRLIGEEAEHE